MIRNATVKDGILTLEIKLGDAQESSTGKMMLVAKSTFTGLGVQDPATGRPLEMSYNLGFKTGKK